MTKVHQLSRHVTLRDMCKSETALRHGIDNQLVPGRYGDDDKILNLEMLSIHVVDKAVDEFGMPKINSGYRGRLLNTLIGGAWRSQHLLGEAVDFEIMGQDNMIVARWMAANLTFDQLILEHYDGRANSGWIHVSYTGRRKNRGEVLRKLRGQRGYVKGLD